MLFVCGVLWALCWAKCLTCTWARQSHTVCAGLCVQMYFIFTRSARNSLHRFSWQVQVLLPGGRMEGGQVGAWMDGCWRRADGWADGECTRTLLRHQTHTGHEGPEISVLPGHPAPVSLASSHQASPMKHELKGRMINDFMMVTADQVQGVGPV